MPNRASPTGKQVWVSVRCVQCWTQAIVVLDGITAHLPPVVLADCPACTSRTRCFVLAAVIPLVPRAKVVEMQLRVKAGEGLTYSQQALPLLDPAKPAQE